MDLHPSRLFCDANDRRDLLFCRNLLVVLPLAILLGPTFARAEVIRYADGRGRRVYINRENQELRRAVARGGVSAALRVIERRKLFVQGIEPSIEEVARQNRIDAKLVHAVIEVESAWNPRVRSPKGAVGLMQLMPETVARTNPCAGAGTGALAKRLNGVWVCN